MLSPVLTIDNSVGSPVSDDMSAQRSVFRLRKPRLGMTLIEVLIAATVTLVLLLVMIQAFNAVSKELTKGRATINLATQLRTTTDIIRKDLGSVSCNVRPWINPTSGEGYFEYVEALPFVEAPAAPDNAAGDLDDMLFFTARSLKEPFRGRWINPTTGLLEVIESPVAEIAIFPVFIDRVPGVPALDRTVNDHFLLCRRVLLVRPDLPIQSPAVAANAAAVLNAHYQLNDVSARWNGGTNLLANTMSDLTKRENRFAHQSTFPHSIDAAALSAFVLDGEYKGQDIIGSDLLAFDVKAFDPNAMVYGDRLPNPNPLVQSRVALTPGDAGYAFAIQQDIADGAFNLDRTAPNGSVDNSVYGFIGRGAYVDLNYRSLLGIPIGTPQVSVFSEIPALKSQGPLPNCYCTWSTHYEADGINQDGNATTDEGTDGLDNNNNLGPDDETERETSPPYPSELRGVKVIIRMVEPKSQQIRQSSVVVDFANEQE